MRLISFDYKEFEGDPMEWSISGLTLNQVNLIVGKNASGKTRTLNVIKNMARLICGQQKEIYNAGNFHGQFQDDGSNCTYHLEIDNRHISKEEYIVNGEPKLRRGKGGLGRIFANELNDNGGGMLKFQTPDDQLAIVARLDEVQHPYLRRLNDWGKGVRTFEFGKTMGHPHLAVLIKSPIPIELDDTDENQVVMICRRAIEAFGDSFKAALFQDMAQIGYDIEDISVTRPRNILAALPGDIVGISVKERDLASFTDQPHMSQGMFRSLSVLIHLNYAKLTQRADCILIDDIGEGLDFDRSCALIDLLRAKASASNFQLVMSTNDRFVMNRVPLEEWCVLQRKGSSVRVRNFNNSREQFEEFRITGLNNFDLLATDFLSETIEHGQDGALR